MDQWIKKKNEDSMKQQRNRADLNKLKYYEKHIKS